MKLQVSLDEIREHNRTLADGYGLTYRCLGVVADSDKGSSRPLLTSLRLSTKHSKGSSLHYPTGLLKSPRMMLYVCKLTLRFYTSNI